MEQGNGAPIGATSSAGQAVSFETGAPEFGNGSNESSLVQAQEFGNDFDHTADSRDQYINESSELVEGQEISFGDGVERNNEASEEEISEPQMDPEKSLVIAKNDGFEPALEYYAHFPVSGGHTEDDEQIDGQQHEDGQEQEEVQEGQKNEADTSGEENENIQEEESNMMPSSVESQRPELQQVIDVLKGQSEIMKKMIERLEDRQALNEEMLLLMAMAMRDALEAKDEKDEDEKTMLDTLVSVIGFLMGMMVDPDKESKRLQENVEKAA